MNQVAKATLLHQSFHAMSEIRIGFHLLYIYFLDHTQDKVRSTFRVQNHTF